MAMEKDSRWTNTSLYAHTQTHTSMHAVDPDASTSLPSFNHILQTSYNILATNTTSPQPPLPEHSQSDRPDRPFDPDLPHTNMNDDPIGGQDEDDQVRHVAEEWDSTDEDTASTPEGHVANLTLGLFSALVDYRTLQEGIAMPPPGSFATTASKAGECSSGNAGG